MISSFLHTFSSARVSGGIRVTFWCTTKTTAIWTTRRASGVPVSVSSYVHALSPFLTHSKVCRLTSTCSAYFLTNSSPSLSTHPALIPPLSSSTISPRPNPTERCISYYQSLMNLDLKMEYCPETNLSCEEGVKEKILAEELGAIILGA